MDAITEAHPNLEVLELISYRDKTSPSDDRALSGITFSKLTKLSLRGFQLRDGAALLKVGRRLFHIFVIPLLSLSFFLFISRSSTSALNLKFFTLRLTHWKRRIFWLTSSAFSVRLPSCVNSGIFICVVAMISCRI